MGWQPDSKVFVLGEALHFRDDGERIPPDEQEYIYNPFILEKLGLSNSILPINTLPNNPNPLYTLWMVFVKLLGITVYVPSSALVCNTLLHVI